jgi:hypothetical protein
MDNLAPDEADERLARNRPCQLRANCAGKIYLKFQLLAGEVRGDVWRRARTAEH